MAERARVRSQRYCPVSSLSFVSLASASCLRKSPVAITRKYTFMNTTTCQQANLPLLICYAIKPYCLSHFLHYNPIAEGARDDAQSMAASYPHAKNEELRQAFTGSRSALRKYIPLTRTPHGANVHPRLGSRSGASQSGSTL